jgi:hypothetical protein
MKALHAFAISACSDALVKLGAPGIQDFTEDSAEARVANLLYSTTLGSMIQHYNWSFKDDPGKELPAYFRAALVARLAAEFCVPLTENGERAQRLGRRAKEELKVAKLVDSQQDKQPIPERL